MNPKNKILYQAQDTPSDHSHSDLTLKDKVLVACRILPWASKRHIQQWIRGVSSRRDSGIEKELKWLVRRGTLKEMVHGSHNNKIYSIRRRTDKRFYGFSDVYHYLQCSECAVHIHRSKLDAIPIAEKDFRTL